MKKISLLLLACLLSSSLIQKQLTHYAENVSTGNMLLRLPMKHAIISKEQVKTTQNKIKND